MITRGKWVLSFSIPPAPVLARAASHIPDAFSGDPRLDQTLSEY
jgi:hypothetical protein